VNFKLNKKIVKTKNAVFSLSLILMLSMTIIIALAQPSSAQVGVPQPVKTVGYISVAPSLVGVGQEATVNLWTMPMPTNYAYRPFYKGFDGVTVTFTKPDGTTDSFKPTDGTCQFAPGQTQALGAIYFTYAPNMAGNWSVSFTMPAQNLTDSTGTVLYTACTSNTAYFTVQTDPVMAGLLNGYPWATLPNSNVYWSYPINANNREWSQISGEWLGITTVYSAGLTHWQPYGSGPNTSHIVWSQSLKAGGIIGGDYGSISYSAGMNLGQAVIMEGKVFVNVPNTTPVGSAVGQFRCFDLTTGRVLYTANGSITAGLHTPGNAYSQGSYDPTVVLASSYGSIPTPYLYGTSGTTWNYYDPFTGTLVRSIFNCSSAQLVEGTNSAYGVASGKLFAWNMSKVTNNNWPTGTTWTITLPTPNSANAASFFGISADQSTIVVTARNQFWGYRATDGVSLWNLTITYPVMANEEFVLFGVDGFIVYNGVDSTFNCYSMLNGNLLWTSPSFSSSPWATTWTTYVSQANDYDNLYLQFPDGTMAALSLKTGKTVWRSEAIPSTEYPNNAVPFVIGMTMVGGNLYGYAGYSVSYQLDPIPRFAMLVCVNATTGDITWTLNGGVYPVAASNGYFIALGQSDGILYCLGKGQTTTTVTAQQQIGGSVLVQGSVLDLSAAQPNTPAISDADMSVWMDYTNMQNSTLLNNPPQCAGVQVTLTAVDPNGNLVNIGTTTSDVDGHFAYQWSPTMAGLYKIYATFEGSNSYFTSHGVTSATVASAASPTAAPTSATEPVVSNSDMIMYFAATGIAIVIAIAMATVLILRKK
jgi:hypothetical protein